MKTNKHAYLIIAHKNDVCFQTLLELIDDVRNDVFIHMDKKCKDYDINDVQKKMHFSRVFHIKRKDVTWGGASQIWTEINLLRKATSVYNYQYYHLISGQDLPIKTQNYIHHFFDLNNGKEFVHFQHSNFDKTGARGRVNTYHLLQEFIGRDSKKYISVLNNYILQIQKYLGINRNKDVTFYKGANWFSITDAFARYVVDQYTWIRSVFRFTFCSDEIFLQTLLMMSPYKNQLYWKAMDDNYHAIVRLIDWQRGNPYTFRFCDKDELLKSDMLFCRKFDGNIDSDIIFAIAKYLSNNNEANNAN